MRLCDHGWPPGRASRWRSSAAPFGDPGGSHLLNDLGLTLYAIFKAAEGVFELGGGSAKRAFGLRNRLLHRLIHDTLPFKLA